MDGWGYISGRFWTTRPDGFQAISRCYMDPSWIMKVGGSPTPPSWIPPSNCWEVLTRHPPPGFFVPMCSGTEFEHRSRNPEVATTSIKYFMFIFWTVCLSVLTSCNNPIMTVCNILIVCSLVIVFLSIIASGNLNNSTSHCFYNCFSTNCPAPHFKRMKKLLV